MKRSISLLLIFTLSFSAKSQLVNFQSLADVPYNSTEGGTILGNGDFIIHGLNSASEGYFYKLNNQGDTVFSRLHQKGVAETNLFYDQNSLVQTSDGGFYYVKAVGGVLIFRKIDSNGNEIWTKQTNKNNVRYAKCVTDGTELFYAVGEEFSGGNNITYGSLDALGNENFTNEIDLSLFVTGDPSQDKIKVYDMKRSAAGTNIAAGTVQTPSQDDYAFVFEFDDLGNLLWFKTFYNTSSLISYASNDAVRIGLCSNGDILMTNPITLNFAPGVGLSRLNSTGDLIWSKFFSVAESTTHVIELSNGNISMNVSASNATSDNVLKNVLITLNAAGDFVWSRAVGSNYYTLLDMKQTLNGEIMSIGVQLQSGYNAYMYTVDTLGNAVGCFDVLDSIPQSAWTPQDTILSQPINSTALTLNNYTITNLQGTNFNPYSPFLTSTATVSNPLCFGGTGDIIYTPSNGVSPYTYSWSNGSTNKDIIGEIDGQFIMRVSDNKGCVRRDTFDLIEPTDISFTAITSDVDCFGSQNGAIDLTPSGGTPTYSYSWSNTATTEDLAGLGGGFYQLTLTDANGCTKQFGVGINEPQNLVAAISNSQNVSCFGLCDGQIASFGAGGVAPYTYLWNDGLSQTNDTAFNLCGGNYLLTLTDANGCIAYSNANISEPSELNNTTTTWTTDCFATNGSAMANPTGGTSPYQYDWDGTGLSANDSIGNLAVGSYSLDITDANGCVSNQTFTIASNVAQVEMCVVTVNDQNQNVVAWEKPTATNLAGFNVYRNIGGIYTQIGFTPYDSLSNYTDTEFGIDPNITSYRYKISVLDSCGNESSLSNYHETIHLTTSIGLSGEVNLIWDDYEGFTFSQYEIWRDTTGLGNWELLNTVLSTNFTYTDFTVPLNLIGVDYAIDVVLPSTCTATGKATDYNSSRSNKSYSAFNPNADLTQQILKDAKVYPNPTNSHINIVLNSNLWSYTLLDLSGKVIMVSEDLNNQQESVDLSDLESGIYLIQLTIDGTTIHKRIVKN